MRDIRYAIRALARTPTVTLTSLLVMALGIGATTAIFSVANAVLFRPLPYAAPERLVQFDTLGVLELQAYREQSQSFEGLISYTAVNRNLHDDAAPERISVVAAERGLFDLLGVRPLAGRTFVPTDPPNVAVVSEGFWRRRYGSGEVGERFEHRPRRAGPHCRRDHARLVPVPVSHDDDRRLDSDGSSADRKLVSAD
jgi:hypothetical protein